MREFTFLGELSLYLGDYSKYLFY